ncbi:MAG TPA: hypothetical protein VEJ85_02105 [Thermoplasmata archaeon]|nr:hypothetical protein [Thermoplasmata archaeon]
MKGLAWGFFAVLAVLFSSIAILANSDLSVAIPCAAIAVVAAAFLLIDIVERTRWPALGVPPTSVGDPGGVRSAIRVGTRGRFALALLLDSLDRRTENPNVHRLSQEEIRRLEALSPDEFREYLADRIREIEQRT